MRPTFRERVEYWLMLALGISLLLPSMFGLVKTLNHAKQSEYVIEKTSGNSWRFPLGTGTATFLLGWLPCALVMNRLLIYFCLSGVMAYSIGLWLPVGRVVSVIASIVSWNISLFQS